MSYVEDSGELRGRRGQGSRPHAAPSPEARSGPIPKAVIKRLSLYNRVLQNLMMHNVEKVSSQELAELVGLKSAQVRKDLAYFGQFGVPGLGYRVDDLRENIKRILRTDRPVRVALVGVGNLGSALLSYGGFVKQGFSIQLAFDADRRKVGAQRISVPVYHIDELEERIQLHQIDIAILAVPAEAAQPITDRLVRAGVTGILNFVPQRLIVEPHVKVHYVDLTIEIESLSYYLR